MIRREKHSRIHICTCSTESFRNVDVTKIIYYALQMLRHCTKTKQALYETRRYIQPQRVFPYAVRRLEDTCYTRRSDLIVSMASIRY